VHTEYPGNVYGNCAGPSYPHCWTVSLGLKVSFDGGRSFGYPLGKPPPQHLVAAVPYGYNESQLAYGWGDPSNILRSPKDGYYYAAMWNRNRVGLQDPGICMMRSNDLMDPGSWRGWRGGSLGNESGESGGAFDVAFASPYTMAPGDEAKHVCTVLDVPNMGRDIGDGSCPAMGLVWSAFLEKFVMSFGCQSEFLFSTSDDLVAWSPAQHLWGTADLTFPGDANVTAQVSSISYPTFIDPTAPEAFGDNNFYTIGASPYLFWVSIGHSPYTDGRHLWATPITFTKPAQQQQ